MTLASLKEMGASLFPCPACKRRTYWAYPSAAGAARIPGLDRRVFHTEATPTPPPYPVAKPAAVGPASTTQTDASGTERPSGRGPRRVAIELPVRIRTFGLDLMQEITVTHNVSRTGIFFLTDKPYQVGQELRVALNYRATEEPLEQRAQVVRIALVNGSTKRGIGVKYL